MYKSIFNTGVQNTLYSYTDTLKLNTFLEPKNIKTHMKTYSHSPHPPPSPYRAATAPPSSPPPPPVTHEKA